MKIGFVIISHANPAQLSRLVRTLQQAYDNPPIACHHDFSQAALSTSEFAGVQFVFPHVRTRWAQFSVVEAGLTALRLLYENSSPDWFYLLSATDYPTMLAEQVASSLKLSAADALLDFREVIHPGSADQAPPAGNPALSHFSSRANNEIAWRRYVGLNFWLPIIRNGPRLGRKTFRFVAKAPDAPFSHTFRCFFGDHWFCGNQRVARILLNPTKQHLRLRRYLSMRTSPDECYYHTVLANSSGIRLDNATRRYARWNGGGAHPATLDMSDLPELASGRWHLARKFQYNSKILDEIDRSILNLSPNFRARV